MYKIHMLKGRLGVCVWGWEGGVGGSWIGIGGGGT